MAASDADNALMLATIDVNLTRLEKSLAKANALVSNNAKGMGRNLGAANKRLQADLDKTSTIYARATKRLKAEAASFSASIGAFGAGFVGGAAAGLLTQLPRMVGAITSSLADLRAEAEKAGLDVESFQELSYAARQVRIPIDALTDGLKELQLRADEVFGGTGGERFVSLLAQGARSLTEMRREAREVGGVLDEEVIAKAAEIDQAFARISTTVGTALKGAIVEAATALKGFLDLLETDEKRPTSAILAQIADLEAAAAKARAYGATTLAENYETEIAKLRRELSRRALLNPTDATGANDWLRAPPSSAPATGASSRVPVPGARPRALEFDAWDRDAAATRQRAVAIRTVVEALDEEIAALQRSEIENDALERIREAGVALDSAEAQAIREKVAALHAERAAREAAADPAVRAAEEAKRSEQAAQQVLGDSVVDLFRGATQGADGFAAALRNVADRLADLVLQAVLLGQGPLGNLFGLGGRDGGVGGLIGLALGNPVGVSPAASVPVPAVSQAVQAATTSAMEFANGWLGTTEAGSTSTRSRWRSQ